MEAISKQNMKLKQSLYLKGLNCADCARKIEDAAARIEGVESASINLVAQRLTVTAHGTANMPHIMTQAGSRARLSRALR